MISRSKKQLPSGIDSFCSTIKFETGTHTLAEAGTTISTLAKAVLCRDTFPLRVGSGFSGRVQQNQDKDNVSGSSSSFGATSMGNSGEGFLSTSKKFKMGYEILGTETSSHCFEEI